MESEFELTQLWETDMIVQFPKISAIYYGLLQAGYDFYIPERSADIFGNWTIISVSHS